MAKNQNANTTATNEGAAASTTAAVVVVTPKAVTKADKARAIFNDCYAQSPVPQRKDIIGRMVAEAGLTAAGAATYLQNFKDKAGIVQKKAPAKA